MIVQGSSNGVRKTPSQSMLASLMPLLLRRKRMSTGNASNTSLDTKSSLCMCACDYTRDNAEGCGMTMCRIEEQNSISA